MARYYSMGECEATSQNLRTVKVISKLDTYPTVKHENLTGYGNLQTSTNKWLVLITQRQVPRNTKDKNEEKKI